MKATASILALVLCAVSASAQTETLRLELKAADAPAVGQELGRVLRAPVQVQGAARRTVTLNLATASPSLTLDRVAALLGGTWKMKLRIRAGRLGAETSPSPRPVLERNFPIAIQNVPASKAFGLVARDLRADLELEGDLDKRVTMPPVNLSVGVLLDRLCEQAGASWSIRYVIEAPDAPPPPPEPQPIIVLPPPAVQPMPAVAPMPRPVVAGPPTGPQLRAALWADLTLLLRSDASQRSRAIQEFVATAERRIAALAALPAFERAQRVQAARPVLTHWRRLYAGLAPDLKREFTPVSQFLERSLS